VEFLRLLLRYLHLVGFALLFGGFVAQYLTGKPRVNVVMRTGLGTMIVTGLLLALPFPSDVDLNYVKLGVKLGVVLLIGPLFGVAVVRERRGQPVTRPLFLAIGGLTLLNAAIAVFWR
jgi:predicted Abi (CAAX) family protease